MLKIALWDRVSIAVRKGNKIMKQTGTDLNLMTQSSGGYKTKFSTEIRLCEYTLFGTNAKTLFSMYLHCQLVGYVRQLL